MEAFPKPFRWDIARGAQLGRLLHGIEPSAPEGFDAALLAVVARVVALAGDSDLFFVGRSPESLFDLASGLLLETGWARRIQLLPLSLPPPAHLSARDIRTLEEYLGDVRLDPQSIASRPRQAAFVDLVSSGETFATLFSILRDLCAPPVDWRSVIRKTRVVGISDYGAYWTAPLESAKLLPLRCLTTVTIPLQLWDYLADEQPKASRSFGPWLWGDASARLPRRDAKTLQALALAVHLFEHGRRRETRRLFARELSRQPAFRSGWLRSLALELKR